MSYTKNLLFIGSVIVLLSIEGTQGDYDCPYFFGGCDTHCRQKGFWRGRCDQEILGLCTCEHPHMRASLVCPEMTDKCQKECESYGAYVGQCSEYGWCICKIRQ